MTDSANCGECGHACGAGTRCEAGTCKTTTQAACASSCGAHGACALPTGGGAAACYCQAAYSGTQCDSCAAGYQDNDADGTCEPDCSSLSCVGGGACSDASGAARCDCPDGGAGETCALCAPGYQDNDHDGSCQPGCGQAALTCAHGGVCTDASGTAACQCAAGYAGPSCDSCAMGFQDNDTNGTCEPDCSSLACTHGGTCSDATGVARCDCPDGGAGETCAQCATGYQDNDDDGTCQPGCALSGLTCANGGVCADSSGTAGCQCAEGYAGATCGSCAAGYQDDDGDGHCAPECGTFAFPADAGTERVMLKIPNPSPSAMAAGTRVMARIPAGSSIASWLAPDAGPTLLFHDADGGVAQVPRALTPDTGGDTLLSFLLPRAVPAASESVEYGLYRAPAPLSELPTSSVARRVDTGDTLVCNVRSAFFFTIQLRQVGDTLYEINVADGTADNNAYARIIVTDLVTGTVVRDSTYLNGAGSCCTAPTIIVSNRFTITSKLFKVHLETREFSGSHRYFGCADFGTGNPPTSQVGINEFIYAVGDTASTASLCGP